MKLLVSKNVTKNFFLLILDKIVQFLNQIVTSFLIAKSLSPSIFGHYSIAISFITIFVVIASWGADKTLLISCSRNHLDEIKIVQDIQSAIIIRVFISITLSIILFILYKYTDFDIGGKRLPILYTIYLIPFLFFNSWTLFDVYFQSTENFKYPTGAKLIGYSFGVIARVILFLIDVDIRYYIMIFLVEQLLIFAVLLVFINKSLPSISFGIKETLKQVKSLLESGSYVAISSIFILLYMRITQVQVSAYLNESFLGTYSLVQNITEIPNSLASVIVTLFLPRVIKGQRDAYASCDNKNYEIFPILIIFGFIITGLMILTGFFISSFYTSYPFFRFCYFIGVLVVPFSYMAYAVMIIFLSNNQNKLYMVSTIITFLVSFLISMCLIKAFNVKGAVAALVLVQFIPAVVMPSLLLKNFWKNLYLSFDKYKYYIKKKYI